MYVGVNSAPGDAGFCPQGLFPHIISNWDSGVKPHHPALYHGRYLHAEGKFSAPGALKKDDIVII